MFCYTLELCWRIQHKDCKSAHFWGILQPRCDWFTFKLVHIEAVSIALDSGRLRTGEVYILNLTESDRLLTSVSYLWHHLTSQNLLCPGRFKVSSALVVWERNGLTVQVLFSFSSNWPTVRKKGDYITARDTNLNNVQFIVFVLFWFFSKTYRFFSLTKLTDF